MYPSRFCNKKPYSSWGNRDRHEKDKHPEELNKLKSQKQVERKRTDHQKQV
jgi:hypothetical protein